MSADELGICFNHLAQMIATKPHTVQVLFDLSQTKTIPARAPMLAIQSGFLTRENTGRVTVVSSDVIAEILANVAAHISHHEIKFFSHLEVALEYLKATE